MFLHIEIEIGLERSVYSVAEGESVEVCVIIVGPEQISMGLEAFAMLTALPGTADRECKNTIYLARMLSQFLFLFTNREGLCIIYERCIPNNGHEANLLQLHSCCGWCGREH